MLRVAAKYAAGSASPAPHGTPRDPGVHFHPLFLLTVTRTELAQRIAQATGLTRIETEAVLGGFAALVEDALVRGERVEWRGFGVFDVQERAARSARNPGSGLLVEIPARRVPVFRPARELRAAVAGGVASVDPRLPSRDA